VSLAAWHSLTIRRHRRPRIAKREGDDGTNINPGCDHFSDLIYPTATRIASAQVKRTLVESTVPTA
jgi:hypothetical protein